MSNQMIEALQGIMNQAQGETLDVPHPSDIKNVREVPLTDWYFSMLKPDSRKDDDGDRHHDVVSGRICEITHIDEFGEPLGQSKLVLQHKYGTAQRQSKDVSVTAIKPNVIRDLKTRFPKAFDELEMKLLREGADLPIVLLDNVPPEVVQVIMTMSIRTIRQFAEFDETQIETLLGKLHHHKMAARANFVLDYLQRAKERAGMPSAPVKRAKQVA